MLRSLQPGPIEYEWQGSVWCSGWVQRLDNLAPAMIAERVAGWRQVLERGGRSLTDEPTVINRGSYDLVVVRFQPYPTGKLVRERGKRGGEQAAERRASWMTRPTGSLPSLAPQPV